MNEHSSVQLLDGTQLLSIRDVAKAIPGRNGRKLHHSTVYRWMTKGVRGKILESVTIGGTRFTTEGCLKRFICPKLTSRVDDLAALADLHLTQAGI
jgi:hypothetical protein